jgi:[glutamine synthetase] adenylyltransferase / [glutamine synthetase]-adenylyl-L-tyrosine phosphorylase
LKLAASLGLVKAEQALAVHDAYRRFRRLQHALRLKGEKYARVERATLEREIAAVKALWDDVLGGADAA